MNESRSAYVRNACRFLAACTLFESKLLNFWRAVVSKFNVLALIAVEHVFGKKENNRK